VMYILKIKEVDVMVNCGFFFNVIWLCFLGFLIVLSGEGGDTVGCLSSGNTHSGRIYS